MHADAFTSPSVSLGRSSIVSGSMMRTVTPGSGTPTQPRRRVAQDFVPVCSKRKAVIDRQ
jgi:hypothetical protein